MEDEFYVEEIDEEKVQERKEEEARVESGESTDDQQDTADKK